MAKEPQLLPGVPRERVYVKVGHSREIGSILKNLKFPPKPPAAPPPRHAPIQKIVVAVQSDQEEEAKAVRAQLARMQHEIEQLRRQLAAANARIDELQQRPAPR